MTKKIIDKIRCIHGRLYEERLVLKRRHRQVKELKNTPQNTVFLIGTPIHPNIGDSAIAASEIAFLSRIIPKHRQLTEVTEELICRRWNLVAKILKRNPDSPIMLHGGGNMGDLWIDQELMRRRLISSFPNHRMIMFPQTVFYSDTDTGKALELDSIPIYNNKNSLTLIAREKKSFEIMRSLYPDTKTLLIPDIVLYSCPEDYNVVPQTRNGVLMCFRNDGEKNVTDNQRNKLKQVVSSFNLDTSMTDMSAERMIYNDARAKIISEKMQEFCGAELVITDRLHGMVFAALTSTPCIVFSNYNHKVSGTYEWIRSLSYVRFVNTVDEVEQLIPELLATKDCKFDNSSLMPYYEILKELVENACR